MTTPAKFGGSIKNGPDYYREYTVTSYKIKLINWYTHHHVDIIMGKLSHCIYS